MITPGAPRDARFALLDDDGGGGGQSNGGDHSFGPRAGGNGWGMGGNGGGGGEEADTGVDAWGRPASMNQIGPAPAGFSLGVNTDQSPGGASDPEGQYGGGIGGGMMGGTGVNGGYGVASGGTGSWFGGNNQLAGMAQDAYSPDNPRDFGDKMGAFLSDAFGIGNGGFWGSNAGNLLGTAGTMAAGLLGGPLAGIGVGALTGYLNGQDPIGIGINAATGALGLGGLPGRLAGSAVRGGYALANGASPASVVGNAALGVGTGLIGNQIGQALGPAAGALASYGARAGIGNVGNAIANGGWSVGSNPTLGSAPTETGTGGPRPQVAGLSFATGGSVPARVTQDQIYAAADLAGIDRDIFARLIHQESGGRTDAHSGKDAYGPAQLLEGTAKELGVDRRDPWQNLVGGALYFRKQQDRFGTPELAAAAYNAGPGRIERVLAGKASMPGETHHYVGAIFGHPQQTQQTQQQAGIAGAAPVITPYGTAETDPAEPEQDDDADDEGMGAFDDAPDEEDVADEEEPGQQPDQQTLARGGIAHAGITNAPPFQGGLLQHATPGRTDQIHTAVPAGSYIIPADVVSGMGQGNTLAGAKKLDGMIAKAPRKTFRDGGLTPVRLSGGEYSIHPAAVAGMGGASRLDDLVAAVRASTKKFAATAKPPK